MIEGKHSTSGYPSLNDVKDGLLKMILYTNLKKVYYNNEEFVSIPILKLTAKGYNCRFPSYYDTLLKEAEENKFKVIIEKV